MPTYSYKCDDCEQDFDIEATVEEKIAGVPDKFICPQCGSSKVTQNFSLEMLIEKANNKEQADKKTDESGPTCPLSYDWAKEKRALIEDAGEKSDSCKPGGGGCC